MTADQCVLEVDMTMIIAPVHGVMVIKLLVKAIVHVNIPGDPVLQYMTQFVVGMEKPMATTVLQEELK